MFYNGRSYNNHACRNCVAGSFLCPNYHDQYRVARVSWFVVKALSVILVTCQKDVEAIKLKLYRRATKQTITMNQLQIMMSK
jgi:hypothetical protein